VSVLTGEDIPQKVVVDDGEAHVVRDLGRRPGRRRMPRGPRGWEGLRGGAVLFPQGEWARQSRGRCRRSPERWGTGDEVQQSRPFAYTPATPLATLPEQPALPLRSTPSG